MPKRIFKSKELKQLRKICCFCKEDDAALLDTHRIVPGCEGGKYTAKNSITVCATHHRLIHSGKIEVIGKYPSTAGKFFINYKENGEDFWILEQFNDK